MRKPSKMEVKLMLSQRLKGNLQETPILGVKWANVTDVRWFFPSNPWLVISPCLMLKCKYVLVQSSSMLCSSSPTSSSHKGVTSAARHSSAQKQPSPASFSAWHDQQGHFQWFIWLIRPKKRCQGNKVMFRFNTTVTYPLRYPFEP